MELFYQQNVIEHMKSSAASEKDKTEMMGILKRMADLEGAEDEAEGDASAAAESVPWAELLERLERGEDVLASLPAAVRADFERAVADGRLSEEVRAWEPWWASAARITPLPVAKPAALPRLASLVRAPSPLLAFGVVDMAHAYAVAKRLWQGDWTDDAPAALAAAMQLSAALTSKEPHTSVAVAMQAVTERCVRHSLLPCAAAVATMADVARLLARHDYALAALTDLHALFTGVMRQEAAPAPAAEKAKAARRADLLSAERKLFLHVVFLHEMPPALLAPLAAEAEALGRSAAERIREEQAADEARKAKREGAKSGGGVTLP